MRNIKKILAVFIIIVLALGTLIAMTKGFNYRIEYKEVTEYKFMLGEVLDLTEVEAMVKLVFKDKEVKIQKIDYFNDSINLAIVNATDAEMKVLIDLFNYRYDQNNTLDTVSRVTVAHTPLAEIMKPYLLPSIIGLILVAIYMGIRFKSQGIWNVTLLPLAAVLVVEAIHFVAYAILQIPITIWTMPTAIGLMIITLTLYAYKFERNM